VALVLERCILHLIRHGIRGELGGLLVESKDDAVS
jgi:hypothetical protein